MKGRLVLAFLVLVVICVGYQLAIAADGEFLWKYVGRQAYTGTPEQAIEQFTSVIPLKIGNAFIDLIKKEVEPVAGVIKKGDRLDVMVFGKNELRTNVLATWEDGITVLKTEEWTVVSADKRYVLKRPLTCNNWSVVVGSATTQKTAPVAQAATPPVVPPAMPKRDDFAKDFIKISGSPLRYHTIVIRVWSGGDLATETGRQSRDLGALLRALAREGKLKPYAGDYIFQVEFRNLDFEAAKNKTVYVNGNVFLLPETFGPAASTVSVPVANGEGHLSIPFGIITEDTAVIVHSPWLRPNIKYPPSGSLKTCAKSTAEICGGEVKAGESSEFYRLVISSDKSNYHFIK